MTSMETLSRIASFRVPLWLIIIVYGISIWGFIFLYVYSHTFAVYEINLPSFEGKRSSSLEFGPRPSFEDEKYFTSVKETFTEKEVSFILTDLKEMEIEFYKKGELEFTLPIAAKGQDGTWTETPAGLYSVEWKAGTHHSTLYDVTMPYSIQFFGNYFMHGWPYHPDGRPVSSVTSAGCIRLDTEDARKLYNAAEKGMPVLVFEEDHESDDYAYFKSVGTLDAGSYLAIDIKSNFIFSQKEPEKEVSIGGFSKLLLATIAGEKLFVRSPVNIPEKESEEETDDRFESGEEVSLFTLLAVMLIESSDEAAEAIIEHLGEEKITSLVKNYLYAMGMEDTKIPDPKGGQDNVSTLEDVTTFSKYLYFNRMSLLNISGGELRSIYLDADHREIESKHDLAEFPEFKGGFIPHNGEKFENMGMAIFEIKVRDKTRPVAIIVASSTNPVEDITKIFNSIKLNP